MNGSRNVKPSTTKTVVGCLGMAGLAFFGSKYFLSLEPDPKKEKLYLALKPDPEVKESDDYKNIKDWNPFEADYTTELEKVLLGDLTNYEKYKQDVYEAYRFSKLIIKALNRAKLFKIPESFIDDDFKSFLVDFTLAFIAYGKEKGMSELKDNKDFDRIAHIFTGYDTKEEIEKLTPLSKEEFDLEVEKAKEWRSNVLSKNFDYDWDEIARRVENQELWGEKIGNIGWNLLGQTKKQDDANKFDGERFVGNSCFVKFLNNILKSNIALDISSKEVKFIK